MNARKLIILLVLAGALVVAAALVLGKQQRVTSAETEISTPAVVGLQGKINDVRHLSISQSNLRTDIELDKDGVWRVKQLTGYPADLSKIRQYLYQLASAKRIERGTADPEMFSRVRLSDDTGVRIKGAGTEDAPVFDVVIGKFDRTLKGTFLRVHDENQSWLVSEKLTPEVTDLFWVDPVIVNVERSRIWQIRLGHEGLPPVEIDRERPAADFLLKNIPEGKELTGVYDIYSIATAVENMRLSNVAKSDALPDAVKTTAHFLTIDGLELEVRIAPGKVRGTHWAQVEARFLPEAIIDTEEAKKLSKKPEEVQKEVAEINARVGGWIYILDDFPYKLMTRRMDEVTKPITTEKDKKKAAGAK